MDCRIKKILEIQTVDHKGSGVVQLDPGSILGHRHPEATAMRILMEGSLVE